MTEMIFIHLAIILLIAFIVSFIARAFKQPIVIGYIIAGVLISPFVIKLGASREIINVFSEFGVAFLLFMVGLHLNPKIIKEIGAVSLFVGLGQMILTFGLGFLASNFLFNFNLLTSVYIGIALAFSSTIIVMKLVSDKRQLDSLYSKISIGILIVQDFAAIGILMFISSTSNSSNVSSLGLESLLAGLALIVFLFLLGFFALPGITRSIAKSQELLFLFSISWAFVVAGLFIWLGFSLEIGALIAGMVLSMCPYSTEISAKIRPLRDFFLIIFFIILGLNVQITNISTIIYTAIILSLLALIFKPLILMTLMTFMGYTKRTNFLVGTTLSQISEFSLIVLGLGYTVGHISSEILSTITLTAIFTITLSTYLMIYSNKLYKLLNKPASIFELKRISEKRKIHRKHKAILFGYNRMGFSILKTLKKIKKKYLVIDFNPDIINDLNKVGISSLYGDAYDHDLLDELPLNEVEIAVSTIPDYEINLLLIETIRKENPNAIIIARAHTIEDAFNLYKEGANYVITPHFLGGEYVSDMIQKMRTDKKSYEKEKNKHIKLLEERVEKGQQHPEIRNEKGES